jgi:HSP20 family protein
MWKDPWWSFKGSRIFEEMNKEFAEAEEMMNRMFMTVHEISPSDVAANSPYYYGYQITMGPDGKPRVRKFGNIKPSARGLIEQAGIRQPLFDTAIDGKENTLIITAEMPGINKEDIKVNMADQYVTIHAGKGDKKYHTDIPVDVELDDTSAKATYSNGILELKIKLKQALKSHGKEIKVE